MNKLIFTIIALGGLFMFGCNIQTEKSSYNNDTSLVNESNLETATFSGGCFWCSESDFEKHDGVISVISGFAGGEEVNPEYKQVASGSTGHREAVQITYDSSVISYEKLLEIYWKHIDPTDEKGSFVDRGFQYSSAIFYHNEKQKQLAQESKDYINELGIFDEEVVTSILPFTTFYAAEEYHQDYYKKNPLKYKYYRSRSGRDDFIEENWMNISLNLNESVQKYDRPNEEEIKSSLNEQQYYITQKGGTEKPFDNMYWNNTQEGIYVDIVSGEPLFSSTDKFKSGTGWPSFTKPIDEKYIVKKKDFKLVVPRTEIKSYYGDSHLGHVFKDGPEPTGLRYCMNSAAMKFIPKENLEKEGYSEYLYLFE